MAASDGRSGGPDGRPKSDVRPKSAGRGRRPGRGRGQDQGQGQQVRDVAHRVLRQVAKEGAFATLALGAALKSSGLDARDRALVTELCYGSLRQQMRLDRALAALTPRGLGKLDAATLSILRVAAYEILFLERVPAHASVNSAVRAARRLGGQRFAGFANGVLRTLAREGEPALPPESEPRAHLAIAWSTPGWILDALSEMVPAAELSEAVAAFNQPAPLTLRAHGVSVEALAERLRALHPQGGFSLSPLAPQALLAEGLGDPELSQAFAEGQFAVQDLGAQLAAHLLAPAAGARVLDACAGVGGKSAHLAALVGPEGRVDAADRSAGKLRLCAEGAARLGADHVHTAALDLTSDDAVAWARAGLAEAYDAVLLDAPCSGMGVLRRHPEAKLRLQPGDVGEMAALQARLLDAVSARVRPGGVLVYSVCTFTRAEGPAQIAAFLDRRDEFALEAPPSPAESGVDWAAAGLTSEAAGAGAGTIRTWPHRHGADGFFLARLRRRA